MELDHPQEQTPIIRGFSSQEESGWEIFSLKGRVDAFNFDEVKSALVDSFQKCPHQLAIDLSEAEFVSIPFIKVMAEIARDLSQKGFKMALVSPSEKLKRQIDIFATLDEMTIFRSRISLLEFRK